MAQFVDASVLMSCFCHLISAYSLKCYSCFEYGRISEYDTFCSKSKLDVNESKYVTTCLDGFDTCQRAHAQVTGLDIYTVALLCSSKTACEEAKKDCEDTRGDGGENCGVACCTTDKCNAGSSIAFSVFRIAVSSLLGLALMK